MSKKLLSNNYWPSVRDYLDKTSKTILSFISSSAFLYIILCWFVIQAVFFVFILWFGLPPDETYHFTFIKLFSEHLPSPFLDVSSDYPVLYDMTTRTPFFIYHYLLSYPYLLVKDSESAFIFLRLINVAMGLATLVMVIKLAAELKISKLARNIAVFMLANTAMFVFLFSGISYDNLFILLSISGVYILLKLINKITAKNMLLFIAILLLGLMVKINFLPVAFSLVSIFIWKYYKKIPQVFISLKKSFIKNKSVNLLLIFIVVVFGFLFIYSYVGNILQYNTPIPKCDQVQSINVCRENQTFVRNEYIKQTMHPSEMGVGEYIFNWFSLMNQRTFGIFAHKQYEPVKVILYSIFIIGLLGLFAIIRLFRKRDKLLAIILVICLFNIFILLLENYLIYKGSGRPSFAIHGRYLFGILPLIYLLGAEYFTRLKMRPIVQCVIVVFALLIFFISSLPIFIKKTDPEWYSPSATIKIDSLKKIIK